MLIATRGPHRLAGRPEDIQTISNALVESWAIHLRCLVDFLYPRGPRDTDVIAADFYDSDGQWEQLAGDISPTLGTARERAHVEVAHLTTRRYAEQVPEKEWDRDGLTDEVLALLRVFAQSASTRRLHQTVRSLLGV
jgi:hypothetical protein